MADNAPERHSSLARAFQDFYLELLVWKERAIGQEPRSEHLGGRRLPPDLPATPHEIRRRLLDLLRRQAHHQRLGEDSGDLDVNSEARYVMAALADEIFLHLDWPGRQTWGSQLLESELFSSQHAGREVFERIDRLLERDSSADSELARIYFMALSLGFEGRFRDDPAGEIRLADLRASLYERFTDLTTPRLHLMPDAYANTLTQGSGRRLPHTRPWAWAGVVLLVLWLLGSHALWRELVRELEPMIEILTEDSIP